jgi:hypothetical protein
MGVGLGLKKKTANFMRVSRALAGVMAAGEGSAAAQCSQTGGLM